MEVKTKNFEIYPYDDATHVIVVTSSPRLTKKLNKILAYPYDRKTKFTDTDEAKFKVSNDKLKDTLITLGLPKTYVMARC